MQWFSSRSDFHPGNLCYQAWYQRFQLLDCIPLLCYGELESAEIVVGLTTSPRGVTIRYTSTLDDTVMFRAPRWHVRQLWLLPPARSRSRAASDTASAPRCRES